MAISSTYLKNLLECLCDYLNLQNKFNFSVGCSTRKGSFRTIFYEIARKTGHRFLLIFPLLHEDAVLSKYRSEKMGVTVLVQEKIAIPSVIRLSVNENPAFYQCH